MATFYSQFRLSPFGRRFGQQCDGASCHVRGSQRITDTVKRELSIGAGDTTPDLRITYEAVYGLGCCCIGPAAVVDGEFFWHLTPQKILDIIEDLE